MDTETKIDKWVSGKVGFLIQVGSVIIGIAVVVITQGANTEILRKDVEANREVTTKLQQEIDTISNNHLVHIQTSMQDMAVQMTRLATQLEDHIKQE